MREVGGRSSVVGWALPAGAARPRTSDRRLFLWAPAYLGEMAREGQPLYLRRFPIRIALAKWEVLASTQAKILTYFAPQAPRSTEAVCNHDLWRYDMEDLG